MNITAIDEVVHVIEQGPPASTWSWKLRSFRLPAGIFRCCEQQEQPYNLKFCSPIQAVTSETASPSERISCH
jgi:hypothetical protein